MFDNIDIPVLYKYRPANPPEQIHRLVEAGEIWFGRANDFNDPFDTAITYNFDGLHAEIAGRWALQAAHRHMPHLTENARKQFAAERLDKIRKDPVYLRKMQQEFIDHNYRTFGICSLSDVRNDILMWGHYALNHTGLCVGLNVGRIWTVAQRLASSNQVLDLVKVTYSDTKPQVNFFQAMLDDDDAEHVLAFVSTKSAQWAYEREFRLVLWNHPNSTLVFGPELISEIVFGCKMPTADREALVKFCRFRNPNISFFQASIDDLKYKLNIRPIT